MPLSSCPFRNHHIRCFRVTSEEVVHPSPLPTCHWNFHCLWGLAQISLAFSLMFFCFLLPHLNGSFHLVPQHTACTFIIMFSSFCLLLIKLLTCLLCLWIAGFLMAGVLSYRRHFSNCLFRLLEERKAVREPTVVKLGSVPVTVGRFSLLQPWAAWGGRELHLCKDPSTGSAHGQDRRVQDPDLGHIYSRAACLPFGVLPVVTHCPPFTWEHRLRWDDGAKNITGQSRQVQWVQRRLYFPRGVTGSAWRVRGLKL